MAKKILFVEDDQDDRELIFDVVHTAHQDVEAVFVENGLEAISFLEHAQVQAAKLPCLIVLDLNMPFLDGKETFHQIKTNLKLTGVPIIIFTSGQSPEDRKLFESQGAEYISKPLDFREMHGIVDHMVSVCCKN